MKVSKIPGFGSYGVYIDDVDFDQMTEEQWLEIGQIHMKNLVTIIRKCNVKYTDTVKWSELWGPRRHSSMLTICKDYPGLTMKQIVDLALKNSDIISNSHKETIFTYFKTRAANGIQRVTDKKNTKGEQIGMFPDGELLWHSNEAANPIFAPGVALLGSENMIGSSTGFLQTADYYESVSESFRSELNDMVVIHRFTPGKLHVGIHEAQDRLMQINMCPEEESELPMVINSPGGITGLHYSINTVYGIKGMSKTESDKLFEKINKDLITEKYIYDHWYQDNNDWCFFDNSITVHRRLGEVKGRLAYRVQHSYENIQIKDYNPYFQEHYIDLYNKKLNDLNTFIKENVLESN